jgi:hypothetical protein
MTQARGSRVKRAQTTMRKGASLAAFRAYSIHKKKEPHSAPFCQVRRIAVPNRSTALLLDALDRLFRQQ